MDFIVVGCHLFLRFVYRYRLEPQLVRQMFRAPILLFRNLLLLRCHLFVFLIQLYLGTLHDPHNLSGINGQLIHSQVGPPLNSIFGHLYNSHYHDKFHLLQLRLHTRSGKLGCSISARVCIRTTYYRRCLLSHLRLRGFSAVNYSFYIFLIYNNLYSIILINSKLLVFY